MKIRLLIAFVLFVAGSGAVYAAFSMVQVANNNAGADGFLFGTGGSDFLTPDVPNNKIYAR